MTIRSLVACLRVEPCMDLNTYTYRLELSGDTYSIAYVQRQRGSGHQIRKRVPVDRGVIQARLVTLKNSTVPAFPAAETVCDGTYFELTVEGVSSTLTLGWWSDAPKGAEVYADFAEWLEKSVATVGD